MIKTFIQSIMPEFYKSDPWLNAILDAVNVSAGKEVQRIIDLSNYNDFSRLNGIWLEYYEKLLGIRVDYTKSLDDRRANVMALWKSADKPTKELLQAICNGWQDGAINLDYDYTQGLITLTFTSEYGVPSGIEDLKRALANVVPAHLRIFYDFKYLLVQDVHEVMTLEEIETKPMSIFAF